MERVMGGDGVGWWSKWWVEEVEEVMGGVIQYLYNYQNQKLCSLHTPSTLCSIYTTTRNTMRLRHQCCGITSTRG